MHTNSFNLKPPKYRIALKDIFLCFVRLERLSDAQITQGRYKNGHRKHERSQYFPDQLNHSSLSQLETFSHSNGISKLTRTRCDTEQTNTSYDSSDCSPNLISASDDESAASNDRHNDYGTTNGEKSPYPLDFGEFNVSAVRTEVGRTSLIITNGRNIPNKPNSTRSIRVSEESQKLSGMDTYNEENAPNEMEEGDDDMAFLYGLQKELDQSAEVNGLSSNCDSDGNEWPTNRIFGDVCLKFLRDECYNTYCDYPHILPLPETVETRLKTASQRDIDEVQNNLLLRYDKLMDEFFAVFCAHCGREWHMHRENLREMISIISERPKAASYMKSILDGFRISGMKYITCVNQLLLEVDGSPEDQFNILWKLILTPSNDKIKEHLRAFETVIVSKTFMNIDAINKILNDQIYKQELGDLRDYAVSLVRRCHLDTFRLIDSTLLQSYILHVKSFDVRASQAIQQRHDQVNKTIPN